MAVMAPAGTAKRNVIAKLRDHQSFHATSAHNTATLRKHVAPKYRYRRPAVGPGAAVRSRDSVIWPRRTHDDLQPHRRNGPPDHQVPARDRAHPERGARPASRPLGIAVPAPAQRAR